MGVTKNQQSEETIRQMARAAFGEKEVVGISELSEGLCNAAYKICFADGSVNVLKIASAGGQGLMTNEVGMMDAEVEALQLVEKQGGVIVPKVQYYDKSKTLCSGDYFFMECLEGDNYFWNNADFSEEEKAVFFCEIGEWVRRISDIKGEVFGQLGDKEHRYSNLYDLVYSLIFNVLEDGEKKQVEIGVSSEAILENLAKDRPLFDEVTEPVLVHYDLWEGNCFVKDKHLCGFIDWERAMWGEALMEDRFRRHTRNEHFLKGFGKDTFTEKEMRRIYWYDVLLYLTMMVEGTYREYPDDSQYQWVKPLFEASYQELVK